jgi:hypothetical protein
MLRYLTVIAIGTTLLLLGCDKSDSSSGAGSSAQAPAASGSGEREHHEHEWDGGPHGDHPR